MWTLFEVNSQVFQSFHSWVLWLLNIYFAIKSSRKWVDWWVLCHICNDSKKKILSFITLQAHWSLFNKNTIIIGQSQHIMVNLVSVLNSDNVGTYYITAADHKVHIGFWLTMHAVLNHKSFILDLFMAPHYNTIFFSFFFLLTNVETTEACTIFFLSDKKWNRESRGRWQKQCGEDGMMSCTHAAPY